VVSPLIANVYLHYTFDLWADVWRRKVAKGDVYGSTRSYPATTNTMLFPATSTSCASSGIASIGSGGAFWFAAAKPRGRSGRSLFRSSKCGYHHPTSCILTLKHASTPPFIRAVCVDAHCPGGAQ
jgi:hypothetical protein